LPFCGTYVLLVAWPESCFALRMSITIRTPPAGCRGAQLLSALVCVAGPVLRVRVGESAHQTTQSITVHCSNSTILSLAECKRINRSRYGSLLSESNAACSSPFPSERYILCQPRLPHFEVITTAPLLSLQGHRRGSYFRLLCPCCFPPKSYLSNLHRVLKNRIYAHQGII
jgi:hypothetical protein